MSGIYDRLQTRGSLFFSFFFFLFLRTVFVVSNRGQRHAQSTAPPTGDFLLVPAAAQLSEQDQQVQQWFPLPGYQQRQRQWRE